MEPRPGQQHEPSSSVPDYLAVLVGISITTTGPTMIGNVRHAVIVKTDPGCGPDHGTGVVVAVVC